MGKKKRFTAKTIKAANQAVSVPPGKKEKISGLIFFAVSVTALCFLPMLQNSFTNWDDGLYVTSNKLLHGPDWEGIFTKPIAQNYHPLTIISLAFNYQLPGLDPFSYFLVNLLLHLANTALVFYFIWLLSGHNKWVALLTALVFGVHPMHVESVAWISERKDVLYTFFFLLSLIKYCQYVQSKMRSLYLFSLLFFILSLFSKPAAVVLPLLLFLLDYWKGRSFSWKIIFEKIPFLLPALLFGIITVVVQTRGSIIGLDVYPLWNRPFFASYTLMIYSLRFFIPYPLSAFHPLPVPGQLGLPILLSPVFIIVLAAVLWYFRKNKIIIFGTLFFIINLLLVLQVLSIGLTIVSERYTYVPYIGLAFMFSMLLDKYNIITGKYFKWVAIPFFALPGFVSMQRTKVWKDTGTLWTDAIKHYPHANWPRINRAPYTALQAFATSDTVSKNKLIHQALEDCNIAVNYDPEVPAAYEKRGLIYLDLNRNDEALADAIKLNQLQPGNKFGYYIRGTVAIRQNEPQKALASLDTCLSIDPQYAAALCNRGTVLFNAFMKYKEALADLDKAIAVDAQGTYYLNRSYCHFKLGDVQRAKADAEMALKKGTAVPQDYLGLLNK
jgi:hypothetical protein